MLNLGAPDNGGSLRGGNVERGDGPRRCRGRVGAACSEDENPDPKRADFDMYSNMVFSRRSVDVP